MASMQRLSVRSVPARAPVFAGVADWSAPPWLRASVADADIWVCAGDGRRNRGDVCVCELLVARSNIAAASDAGASPLQGCVEVFVRAEREQYECFRFLFIGQQLIGKQGLLFVELEFVNKHAQQVALFFLAKRWVLGDRCYCSINTLFILSVQFFDDPVER